MIYGLDEYIQLKVLEQYNFTVENHSNGRYTEIHLIRDEICIVYHVWSQFGDNVVFVSDNIQDHHNHIYLGTYNLNWFINNVEPNLKIENPKKRYNFIELVKFYILSQLKKGEPIFGIEINNQPKEKDNPENVNLDKIFRLYSSEKVNKSLAKQLGAKVSSTIDKLRDCVQLNYNYNEIFVTIDFFEDKYNVHVQNAISEDVLDLLSINYEEDLSLEKVISEINEKIKNHPKLKAVLLIEKKKKLYSTIAWISLCLSILFLSGIALYSIITKDNAKGNIWWSLFFVVIPLIVWFVFDVKFKRLK